MSMTVFFVLGSNPTLSIAEISSVLGPDHDYSQASNEILILDNVDQSLDQLQDRLAGVIKIGEVIETMKTIKQDELADLLFTHSYEYEREGKTSFGVSVYDAGDSKLTDSLRKQSKALGLEVKKRFKEAGCSARLVTSRERTLSAVVISTNNVLESGGEFVLIANKAGIMIGQTRSVQDFESWSKRDYGKPKRDTKRGMLPPKLARVMCNLGNNKRQITNNKTLLDPFCGVGTTLIEATLLGINKIVGSDIDQKAINDTKKNLNWLGRELEIDLPTIQLETCPAQEIESHLEGPIDLMVTEPYLGPLQSGRASKQELEKTATELTSLYLESFRSISKLLKKGSGICVVLPVFSFQKKKIYIPVLKELERTGFKLVDPIPNSVPELLNKKTPRNGILYERKGQHVGREVLVFKYSP